MKKTLLLFFILSIACAPQAVFGMDKQDPDTPTNLNQLCFDEWTIVLSFNPNMGQLLSLEQTNENLKKIVSLYLQLTKPSLQINPYNTEKHSKQLLRLLKQNNHNLILYSHKYFFYDPLFLNKILTIAKDKIIKLNIGKTYFKPQKNSNTGYLEKLIKQNLFAIVECDNLSALIIPKHVLKVLDLKILENLKNIYLLDIRIKIKDWGKEVFKAFTKKLSNNLEELYITLNLPNDGHKLTKSIIGSISENLKGLELLQIFQYSKGQIQVRTKLETLNTIQKLENLKELRFVPSEISRIDYEKRLFQNLKALKKVSLCFPPTNTESFYFLLKIIFSAEKLDNITITSANINKVIDVLIEKNYKKNIKFPIEHKLSNLNLIFSRRSRLFNNISEIPELLKKHFVALSKLSYTKKVIFQINLNTIKERNQEEFEKLRGDKRFETHTSVTNNIRYLNIAIYTK